MKKQLHKNIARLMVFTILATFVTNVKPAEALSGTHTLSDYAAGATAIHTIHLVNDGMGIMPNWNDQLSITFPDSFTSNGAFAISDFPTVEVTQPYSQPESYTVIDVNNGGAPDCTTAGFSPPAVAVGITSGAGDLVFTIEFCNIGGSSGIYTFDLVIDGTAGNGELTNPAKSGSYTADYFYDGTMDDSGSNNIEITGASGPGIESNPTGYTTMNRPHLDRLKAGLDDVHFALSFELAATSGANDQLSILFPTGFANVDSSGASATCSGGGTISNWQDDGELNAWADKSNCAGTVEVEGIYVDLPNTPGAYVIQWSNDNGSGAVAIVDDDQVTVTSNVDPILQFDIDTSTATSADTTAPYRVDFGTLDSTQTNVSGEADINYIMIDLSTNATSGAVVTLRNDNGTQGLVSASSPGDVIANAAGTMVTGTENYGFCVQATSEALGESFEKAGSYATGTCADQADGNYVQALSVSDAPILSASGPIFEGRAVISGSAAASILSEAHDDYMDTLTFIATATF
jgi:hypothetical protein